jgi:hypothetical protein
MSASVPSQPPVAMSPPPPPPPPQLAVLTSPTVVLRTASLDAAIGLWLQKSIERVIPLAKALRVSPGAAPAPPGGGRDDEGIAAAFVAQAVLGVPALHDLINATPPPSASKIAMTPDLVTVPLASMPLDDAGYVAGGIAAGIAAILELQSIMPATRPTMPPNVASRDPAALTPAQRLRDCLLLHGGGGLAMSPPSRMPPFPAAQMPPALTLALMHTGLSDAALSALVPRRHHPDDADAQFSTEPPDDDSSSSNAIIPPSAPLLLCSSSAWKIG